jgi:hypothetical protein
LVDLPSQLKVAAARLEQLAWLAEQALLVAAELVAQLAELAEPAAEQAQTEREVRRALEALDCALH